MVEGSGFENRRSRKATRGSNPLSSASKSKKSKGNVPAVGFHESGHHGTAKDSKALYGRLFVLCLLRERPLLLDSRNMPTRSSLNPHLGQDLYVGRIDVPRFIGRGCTESKLRLRWV